MVILEKYQQIFQEGLGLLRGYKAKIHIDPKAIQKYFKARSVPYSLKAKIEELLEKLVKEGVIEPIQYSEWAAPIVPVVKLDNDNTVRICGDFRVTINSVFTLDRYPIPKIEDLLATLTYLHKIRFKQAYQQLPLDDDSKQYAVINTHKGLFRYSHQHLVFFKGQWRTWYVTFLVL